MTKLRDIKAPIQNELQTFESVFKESMKSKVPLLDKITYYIVKRKGKQLRPVFVLLSAKLCGGITEATYIAASMVELLHTATLVHDDVVDDAHIRRGFFSINALWKNKIAVLVGDYLLSRGLLIATRNKQLRLLEVLSDAVQEMSEGELLQMEKSRKLDIDEEVYFNIIRKKTASLISAACAGGAISATDDENRIELLGRFGEYIGIAFQIRDDLFDYGESDIGKPRGIDIREKKMTLPLIHSLQNASRKEKKRILSIIRRHSERKDTVREVISFVRQKGGIEYASGKMIEYSDRAFDILQSFEDSPSREAMQSLAAFVRERKR